MCHQTVTSQFLQHPTSARVSGSRLAGAPSGQVLSLQLCLEVPIGLNQALHLELIISGSPHFCMFHLVTHLGEMLTFCVLECPPEPLLLFSCLQSQEGGQGQVG